MDAIKDCQRAGLVRAGVPEEMAISAWSTMHGLSALLVDEQLQGLQQKLQDVLGQDVTRDLFLGLAPR